MHPTHEFKRHKRGGGGGEANVVSYENTPARYVARKGVRGTGEEEDETRNEQIEADTDRGIKEEGEGERGVRDGMDATQYADGLSGILAHSLSWGRAAKYLRIVTIATPFRPLLPRPTHPTPFDTMEWVNAIDSRAQGAWVEAAPTAATV